VIRFCRWLSLLAVAGITLAGAGCASTGAESDLPWNMSQPWESGPTLPFGAAGGGY